MYALKELLGDALTALIGPRRARQAAVLDLWAEVVGEGRARHARVVGVRGSTLVVATDLPAVYYELGLRRAELVTLLNQRAGGQAITEIQLQMRPLGRSDADDEKEPGAR